nr:MAG TPA: hypothetical protein [Caudoviricetes sp.]DAQ94514.1 MAG TPA: hypothetical protein [Caudoviricetes sp.]
MNNDYKASPLGEVFFTILDQASPLIHISLRFLKFKL